MLFIAAAVAAMLALPGAASAQEDSATGVAFLPTGVPFAGSFVIDLDAHSGPTGENPTGFASISLRAFFLGGPVTCLAVTGNRAVIGGGLGNPGYIFVVEDNTASGAPDRFGRAPFLPAPPTTCPVEPEIPLEAVESGDLVVQDAQPFPTSKDQCKDGGWRTSGSSFTNQGQCVAFVNR